MDSVYLTLNVNPLLSSAAALGSAATLGIGDFTGGLAGRRTPPASVAFGVEIFGLVALPLGLWLLPTQWNLEAALEAFAAGAVGGFGLILFYRAMALNLIAVVAPITAVIAAGMPTVVGLVGGERLHLGQLAGIGVGLIAIALASGLNREASKGTRSALGLAIVAGIAFGLFFILYHSASAAGTIAFLSGRTGSAVVALTFASFTGVSFVPSRSTWRLIGVGGGFDGTGVVLFTYATFHGLLSLSALLTSLYPAFTILCAHFVARERLTTTQWLGAALALVAVALIAVT
jgi:drug/metabolite transporter (DMT)-like permease